MKPIQSRRLGPAELEAMAKKDRNRLIVLTVTTVLLGGAIFGTSLVKKRAVEREAQHAPRAPEGAEVADLVVPPFDGQELLAAIDDATPEGRLVLAGDGLTSLLYYSNLLGPRHYAALEAPALDAAAAAQLLADPAAARARPYRVRGWVEELGRRRRNANLEESYATLRLEDQATRAHVTFLEPAEEKDLGLGDFVHFDGLFAQAYRAPVAGSLIEGPLFAARELERSYPSRPALGADELRALLIAEVDDDQLGDVRPDPHGALWELMAYASERADEVDWEGALELDSPTLGALVEDGEAFRGVPFRLPISINLDSWTSLAGENRLRLERLTRGWIGNSVWKGAAPVIQWIAPFEAPHLADRARSAHFVTGRGFFLRNVFYEKVDGSPGRTPLFVMAAVEPFVPPVDPRPRLLMMGVLFGTIGIIGLIWFLLRRDRRAARRLHEDLVRRRRARAVRDGAGALATESGPGGPA